MRSVAKILKNKIDYKAILEKHTDYPKSKKQYENLFKRRLKV
jgi:uncharacterized iron-regulated protein